jgi:hypothetical protein
VSGKFQSKKNFCLNVVLQHPIALVGLVYVRLVCVMGVFECVMYVVSVMCVCVCMLWVCLSVLYMLCV